MGKPSKKKPTKAPTPPPSKHKGPPFDITAQEYKDLCGQVQDLSLSEIQEEWILAARYGDLDVVHAILESQQYEKDAKKIVNCQDETNGNTALHMAAANGHLSTVQTLLDQSPDHSLVNHAGNTPLHWAAANGHDKVVEMLLQRIKDIDVLKKNEFGRSALTEGFTSEKTEVIKHLLEHDSASEEKLVQGGKEIDAEEEEEKEDKQQSNNMKPKSTKPQKEDGIVHEFSFLGKADDDDDKPLRVRELPIPIDQDCFGDRPELDTTGYGIWAASLVMSRWMAASAERFHGKRILELGAGCGVPGLAAAYYSDAKQVYLTDLNPKTLDNLNYNIQLNQQKTCASGTSWEDRLNAGPINWEDSSTWPSEKIDYIIGSDLIYQESIGPILKKVVLGLCQGQGTFLYVAPDTECEIGRDGLTEFIESMTQTEGISLAGNKLAPQEYHANPLASGNDDLCFLHFHELTSGAYRLYEFQINITQ